MASRIGIRIIKTNGAMTGRKILEEMVIPLHLRLHRRLHLLLAPLRHHLDKPPLWLVGYVAPVLLAIHALGAGTITVATPVPSVVLDTTLPGGKPDRALAVRKENTLMDVALRLPTAMTARKANITAAQGSRVAPIVRRVNTRALKGSCPARSVRPASPSMV